jgi:hypothetical protein
MSLQCPPSSPRPQLRHPPGGEGRRRIPNQNAKYKVSCDRRSLFLLILCRLLVHRNGMGTAIPRGNRHPMMKMAIWEDSAAGRRGKGMRSKYVPKLGATYHALDVTINSRANPQARRGVTPRLTFYSEGKSFPVESEDPFATGDNSLSIADALPYRSFCQRTEQVIVYASISCSGCCRTGRYQLAVVRLITPRSASSNISFRKRASPEHCFIHYFNRVTSRQVTSLSLSMYEFCSGYIAASLHAIGMVRQRCTDCR